MRSKFILVSLVIGFWYFASSINVVASQKLFEGLKAEPLLQQGLEELNASSSRNATGIIFLAVLLTILQLLVGGLLSLLILLVFDGPTNRTSVLPHKHQPSQARISKRIEFCRQFQILDLLIGCLHCFGCICTNIGYGYGSASVVQVIKLLEPIETLLLTALVQVSLAVLSPRKVFSTVTIVGGTYMLLSNPSLQINPTSVFFAIGSGICMASRNVFSKKRQAAGEEDEGLADNALRSNLLKGMKKFATITMTSAFSAIAFGFCLALTNLPLMKLLIPHLMKAPPKILNQSIVFHCLSNLAAISVLCWTSATTHSLLNVGKRIANVTIASIAFHAPLTVTGKIGLGVAAIGGCIYNDNIAMAIRSQFDHTTTSKRQYIVWGLAILLLVTVPFQIAWMKELKSTLDEMALG